MRTVPSSRRDTSAVPSERSLELRDLAQRVVDALPRAVVEEAVLTGSVSRGDADELSDMIHHRKNEHRPGEVVILLIERTVDCVLRAGRHVVGVVDDERLVRERDVTGEAATRDRQDLFLERHDVDRVVLRKLPAKHFLTVSFVEQVQRSGVGP